MRKITKKFNRFYRIVKSRITYYYTKTFIGFGLSTDDEVEVFENIDFEEEI